MSLLRSEKMGLYLLSIEKNYAWEVMQELGKYSALHFLDANSSAHSFSRPYIDLLRRCDTIQKKLKFLESLSVEKFGELKKPKDPQQFLQKIQDTISAQGKDSMGYFEEVEQFILKTDEFIRSQQKEYDETARAYRDLIEQEIVNKVAEHLLWVKMKPEQRMRESKGTKLLCIAGIIQKDSVLRFTRLIFRKSHGNAITFIEDMPKIAGDEEKLSKWDHNRSVYAILVRGEQLKSVILTTCKSFTSCTYEITDELFGSIRHFSDRKEELRKINTMINEGINKRLLELWEIPPNANMECSMLISFKWFFERERIIYSTLNLFKPDNTWYKGICWCPKEKQELFDNIITEMRQTKRILCSNLKEIPNNEDTNPPPTNFRTNSFLQPFNDIVETYGIASYGEINPAVFTIITFPFLFGIMFGDIGHGLTILSVASYLMLYKDSIQNSHYSIVKSLIPYRYLLFLCGIFASFAGLIYNDFASLPLVFNNCEQDLTNCKIPIGMNPKWHFAHNHLQFMNSYKMKLAIIIGSLHMLLGIVLKGLNFIHFGKKLELIFDFLPRLIFMLTFLGYMCLLIVVKWTTDWNSENRMPPSIIDTLINALITTKGNSNETILKDSKMQSVLDNYVFLTICGSLLFMLLIRPLVLFAVHIPHKNNQYHEFIDEPIPHSNVVFF